MKRFFAVLLLLAGAQAAFADSDGHAFPVWTYWVEIGEHAAMFLIALTIVAYLLKKGPDMKLALWGFGIFALAEFLTILHHFLVYPFGVWNAIVNHGLLLVALALVSYSFARVLKAQ